MTTIKALKAQATQLQQALERMGIPLTRAQALEAVAAQYGQPNWDTLSAMAGTSALTVPEVVKSAKGCKLLLLTSGDGAQYDRHAIVPAHLDADAIAAALTEEIIRLKKQDDALVEAGHDCGYTDADLKAFLEQRGCEWVDGPVSPSENWD
jgi:ABC-type spermidine/putrescine transport system permease subunit II